MTVEQIIINLKLLEFEQYFNEEYKKYSENIIR